MLLRLLSRRLDGLRHRLRLASGEPAHAWGRFGEDLAHRYLQQHGMTIVARNFRTRNGSAEVDLIGREGPTLVFIEVKTRASEDFGAPEEAVDREKRRRLVRAASEYLRRCRADESSARFDIVSVTGYDKPSIRHFADAFRPFQDSSTL